MLCLDVAGLQLPQWAAVAAPKSTSKPPLMGDNALSFAVSPVVAQKATVGCREACAPAQLLPECMAAAAVMHPLLLCLRL